ncbi:MAG TPA: alpha/beta hydrolase [Microbacterium sp.]|nr:alpha/beta hydrolase [Microbacterium sp.]
MTRMEARYECVVLLVATIAVLGCGCTQGGGEPSPAGSPDGETAVSSEDVDIGGRSLFLKCWGEPVADQPTVLLIAGQGPTISTWEPMARELAAEGHHLCAYDRAGVGGSDPAPDSNRTTQDQVADLVALLDGADVQEPIVLAAHSMGSLPAVGFVARAPERVAGVVLIDPWSPRVSGVLRAALPPEQPDESPALAEERWFLNEMPFDPAQNPEHVLVSASDEEVIALLDESGPIFGDLPVIVLRSPPLPSPPPGLPEGHHVATVAALAAGYQEFADESTRGTVIEVQETGHNIHEDQPQVVMDAIRDVVAG